MRPAMELDGSVVPPGFRFHPTEEELVGYYLKRKINSQKIDLDVIIDLDLYRMEPWDIQDRCNLGYEEQNEWYFFSHKDKKYPTGTRTNRATAAGFWKATGRDKAVLTNNKVIGMRKTLVFYKGRAPNGKKSDWIMHEYRLQTSEYAPPQEEGWVVCRAFKKPSPSHRQGFEAWNHNYYMRTHPSCHNNMIASPVPPTGVTSPIMTQGLAANACNHHPQAISLQEQLQQQQQYGGFDQEFIMPTPNNNINLIDSCNQLIDLPQLDSPSLSTSLATRDGGFSNNNNNINNISEEYEEKSSTHDHSNWKFLDNLLNSQMPQETMSSSFPRPSLQMVVHGQDNYDHSQMGHFLDCFPNL